MIASIRRTLGDLDVSQSGQVAEIVGPAAVQQRLAEMGLTPGSAVRIVRVAPLGDPVQISLRNYHLSLRRSEMHCVFVKQNGEPTSLSP